MTKIKTFGKRTANASKIAAAKGELKKARLARNTVEVRRLAVYVSNLSAA